MGGGGGKKSQKKAKNTELARSSATINPVQACEDKTSYLKIYVLRSDTGKGLSGIKVKGGAELANKNSAGEKGLADFGEVQPDNYDMEVELTAEQAKLWVLPEKTPVAVAEGTTQETNIVVDPKVELRVILSGYDAKKKKDIALKDLDWKLSGAATAEGKTGADGVIKYAIPADADAAEIEVTYPGATQKVAAEAKPTAAAEDYPIKIQPDAFKDEDEGEVLPKDTERQYKWKLSLADLADGENDDGIKARLWNLGFAVSEGDVAKTKAAVQAYQWLYETTFDGTGALADVEADVKKRHDEA